MVDVKERFRQLSSSGRGVTLPEVRGLRNEIAADAEGVTAEELGALRQVLGESGGRIDKRVALEIKRVLGLGVTQNAQGRGEYSFQPYMGIDATARANWAKRWGARDAYDPKFPTYEKNISKMTAVPKNVTAAGAAACRRVLEKSLGQPVNAQSLTMNWARAIYDVERRHIGYAVTFRFDNHQNAEAFIRMVNGKPTIVGSRAIYDPE